MTLVVLLALAFAGPGDRVTIDGDRWRRLQEPDREEEDPPEPVVLTRDVSIEPTEDEVRFTAEWRISASEGWFAQRLVGPGAQVASATFRGQSVPLLETAEGVHVAIPFEGEGVLRIRGVVAGEARRDEVVVDLMPAAIGRVQVDTELEPQLTAAGSVVRVGDRFWTSAGGLRLRVTDPAPPAPRPDLATATSAVGLTIGEGSYEARARVRWEIRHGELSTVGIDGTGIGADLEVTGPSVASWSRSGSRIDVVLLEPEEHLVELELSWSGPVPQGDEASLALPSVRPQGAFRTESSVQLARDGEIEVVPRLDGWSAVPFSQLPAWGSGLVQGTATAAFASAGAPGGSVGLFRFTPVSAPPTFVDKATITAAMTHEGNVLMRAHYAVRNDRAAHLRVTPPPGAEVVGARVAGETAQVARDGRTWLIPLEKSVETVEGLLSFPVELTLLLRSEDWDRKEARALPLPRVGAPVAVTRATIHLPPGYENRLDEGEGDVVADFADGEGIAYGRGSGQSAAAEALMQEAVQAWMGNSFEEAEGILRELEDLGGFDENARRLQSNLDVISGKGEGQYDVALERRVKEQAKARSLDDQRKQEVALQVAEESYYRGDYAEAEREYKKALEIGQKLDRLEQSESVEYEVRNAEVASQLADVTKKAADKKTKGKDVVTKNISGGASNENTYMLDGVNISDEDTSVVLTEDLLEKVPTGRSYQSAVGAVAGVAGSASGGGGAFGGLGRRKAEGKELAVGDDDRDGRDRVSTTESTGESVHWDFSGDDWIDGDLVMPDGAQTITLDGGVVGGEVGGVMGGVVGGIAVGADEPAPPPAKPAVAPEEDEEYGQMVHDVQPTSAEVMLVERRGPRIRVPRIQVGGGKKAGAAPMDESFMPDIPEAQRAENKPAVTAVQLTALIPTQGEAVLYERLLLDADAEYALPIEAILRRRNR